MQFLECRNARKYIYGCQPWLFPQSYSGGDDAPRILLVDKRVLLLRGREEKGKAFPQTKIYHYITGCEVLSVQLLRQSCQWHQQ